MADKNVCPTTMSAPRYIWGAISIGPGSIWGVPGSIIVACGMPGGQAGGGQHLSPRLNQPPAALRQLLQPDNAAITSAVASSKNTFLGMISSSAVDRVALKLCQGNSSPRLTWCKRNRGVLAAFAADHGAGPAELAAGAARTESLR